MATAGAARTPIKTRANIGGVDVDIVDHASPAFASLAEKCEHAVGTMKVGALLPYFGGKREMAPRIVELMGEHAGYIEPFAGSMAVLFAKPASAIEMVSDRWGLLINLARVIASDRYVELVDRVERTLFAEELVVEGRAWINAHAGVVAESVDAVGMMHVDAAYWLLVVSWMGRNGVAGTASYNIAVARRFTLNGGSPTVRMTSMAGSIPAWHERMRSVQIYQMDGIELCERVDDDERFVIYADPPYIRKGSSYICDFAGEDHARLASALDAKRSARVIVSYYDEPELEDLYPRDRWTRIDASKSKSLVSGGQRDKRGSTIAPEVLLLNRPAAEASSAGGLFAGVHS